MPCRIEIDDQSERQPDLDLAMLQRVVERAVADEELGPCQLNVLIVDDAAMSELHGQHFGERRSTDVVSFEDGSRDPASGLLLLGDVAICADVAWRVAASGDGDQIERAHRECLLYIIHGLLHLLGYDDVDDGDRQAMWQRQRALLAPEGIEIGVVPE